jgi:hypothetical protein
LDRRDKETIQATKRLKIPIIAHLRGRLSKQPQQAIVEAAGNRKRSTAGPKK